jgi:pimeloyl-ACP methyl ester carboxylesterase
LPASTLYYAVHNPAASGPSVLFLHGLGSSSVDWQLQVPVFAARGRVITVDLRGHGRSPAARGPLRVEGMAAEVAGLLDDLGEAPLHVVGLSLGGCVGLALALDDAERVRSLTLVNTFARLRPAGVRGAWRLATRLGLLATAPMPRVAAHVARGLFPKPEQQPYYAEAVMRLSRNARGAYFAAMRAVARFDVLGRLGEVRCPTLILAGDRDQTVPRTAALALQRGIAGSTLRVIADSGHATPYDQAEGFNRVVLEFVGTN